MYGYRLIFENESAVIDRSTKCVCNDSAVVDRSKKQKIISMTRSVALHSML